MYRNWSANCNSNLCMGHFKINKKKTVEIIDLLLSDCDVIFLARSRPLTESWTLSDLTCADSQSGTIRPFFTINSPITVNKCFLTFLSNSASNVLLFLLTTAGWKLSPMVGAMYSPELYTGMTTRINVIPHKTDGDKTHECCSNPGGIKTLSFFPLSLCQYRGFRTKQQQQLPPPPRPFEALISGVVPGLSTAQSGQLCHNLPSRLTRGKHTNTNENW